MKLEIVSGDDEVEKKTLAEKVLDKLMDWIMEGKIEMGQKLNTDQLAQQLSVSRMPVRDAIKELERKGLIENIPYKGASLVTLSSNDIFQLYLLRCLIEPELFWYACKNATDQEIENVGEILKQYRIAVEKDNEINAVQMFKYNRAYHFSIYETSRMNILLENASRIWDNLAFYKLIYEQNYVKNIEMRKKQLEDHELFYSLFKERKADELKETVKRSLQNFEEIMPRIANNLNKEKTGTND